MVTAEGRTLCFVVRGMARYRPENAPLASIFGQAYPPNLNLVTRGAAFGAARRQYDQRTLVYTTYAGR